MAIVNRTLDGSEQMKVFEYALGDGGAVATGVTQAVCIVPYPAVLKGAQVVGYGISGSPTWTLKVHRFIVGTGATYFAVSGAQAIPAFGTSGVPQSGVSLLASGHTLLNLMADDVLMVETGGANSAVLKGNLAIAIQPIQDIKKHFTPGV